MFGGHLISKLKTFQQDVRGSVAISVGLMSIPLMMGIGISVDVVRAVKLRTELQTAVDSAVLSAASSPALSTSERKKIAFNMLNANLTHSQIDLSKIKTEIAFKGDTLELRAAGKMPTSLMRLAGVSELSVAAEVAARIAENKNAEIALVLDYSGSMKDPVGGQTKYISMRNAATTLINDMVKIDPKKVKFALVPFSHHVRTTLPSSMVLGATGTSWTGCTQDRPYPANTKFDTPTDTPDTKWGHDFAPEHLKEGCGGYEANKLTIKPLTNDFTSLKAQLADMKPYAWTHIALGVEFGYHTLTPGAPYPAQPFELEDNKKFMVVLTDGAQTEPAFGKDGVRTVEQGEKNLAELCSNAKVSGITIITIAFDLDDNDTVKRLKTCASGAENAFVADNTTELAAAFNTIKVQVLSQVYLSR